MFLATAHTPCKDEVFLQLQQRLSQAQAECALHLETKNELARELQAVNSDLVEQRRTFKISLDQADHTTATLTAALAEAQQRLKAMEYRTGVEAQDAGAVPSPPSTDITSELEKAWHLTGNVSVS